MGGARGPAEYGDAAGRTVTFKIIQKPPADCVAAPGHHDCGLLAIRRHIFQSEEAAGEQGRVEGERVAREAGHARHGARPGLARAAGQHDERRGEAAAEEAGGEVLAFLEPGARPSANWLSATAPFFAQSEIDAVVTPELAPAGGTALGYGGFYGEPHRMTTAVAKRRCPLVGDGRGMMSFIHLHDAAAATAFALEADGPAIYNITDDEPAPMREWLPVLAAALGARPPRHVPEWAGRLIMGSGLDMLMQAHGAANAKAKKELGWTPRYPTWREGFRTIRA